MNTMDLIEACVMARPHADLKDKVKEMSSWARTLYDIEDRPEVVDGSVVDPELDGEVAKDGEF